jgi:plastocyanin
MMRPHRLLLLPLTTLIALAAASPAMALDWSVDVTNFQFTPATRQINVGDTVTWTFTDGGHTSSSLPGQPDRWDSGPKDVAGTFQHTFTKPGRYQYLCKPHRDFMHGTIVVGKDTVTRTVDNLKTRRSGKTVTISFKLNEPAVVTYKLKGPSRRTVSKGRLLAGRHSFKLTRLKAGSYRGVLTLSDDFDNKVTPKNSFVIR